MSEETQPLEPHDDTGASPQPEAIESSLDEVLHRVQPAAGMDAYSTAKVFPPDLIAETRTVKATHEPIRSELPFDDPEFREIIRGFVNKLRLEMTELQRVWERRDFDEVARIAHWMKGAAGTMGFSAFTEPGLKLMNLAREERADEITPLIDDEDKDFIAACA